MIFGFNDKLFSSDFYEKHKNYKFDVYFSEVFFETATFTSVYIFTIWKKLEESEKSVFQVYLLSFFFNRNGKKSIDWLKQCSIYFTFTIFIEIRSKSFESHSEMAWT